MLSSGFACGLRGALRGRFASRHASTRRPRAPCGPGGGWRHRRPARPSCFRSASGFGEAPSPPPATPGLPRQQAAEHKHECPDRQKPVLAGFFFAGRGLRPSGGRILPGPFSSRREGAGRGGGRVAPADTGLVGGTEAGGGAELSRPSGDHRASHARPNRKAAKNQGWG